MDSITLGTTQRRIALTCVLVGVAFLGLAVLLALALHGYVAAIVLGSLGLILVPAGLDAATGRTELTPQGLETRSLFRKHACRWDEVDGIDTQDVSARLNSTTQIVVRLKNRKPIKLCAPFTAAIGGDPYFDQRLEQIKAYQTVHTAD